VRALLAARKTPSRVIALSPKRSPAACGREGECDRPRRRAFRAEQGPWSRRRDARTTTKAGLRRPSRPGRAWLLHAYCGHPGVATASHQLRQHRPMAAFGGEGKRRPSAGTLAGRSFGYVVAVAAADTHARAHQGGGPRHRARAGPRVGPRPRRPASALRAPARSPSQPPMTAAREDCDCSPRERQLRRARPPWDRPRHVAEDMVRAGTG
jgi:hypothetical protein